MQGLLRSWLLLALCYLIPPRKSGTDLSQINAIKRVCLIIKRVPSLLGGGGAVPPPPKGHHYQGGTVLYLFLWGKMEVTMSHWRKSHEPAPQHSYLADWVIAASVVLALVLIAHGVR